MKRVAVLLASYNGEVFISDQLNSIFANKGYNIHVFVSDDGSTDSTREIVGSYAREDITLLNGPEKKCSGENFYHLIMNAEWEVFDYIALADQDDLWLEDKLLRCISALDQYEVDAVSSNVEAYWPDGRSTVIVKSYPQVKYDYFFESAGPGCTYVFPLSTARVIRSYLNENWSAISKIKSHDWLFYAIIRSARLKWKILPDITVRYRQHAKNVAGANQGLLAIFRRLGAARNGWYSSDMKNILDLFEHPKHIEAAAKKQSILLLLRLILDSRQLRRKPSEKILIIPALLIVYISQLVS